MSPEDARATLQSIISLVSDPRTVSEVPAYVRDGLKEGLTSIAAENLFPSDLASKLIGALRLIGDSCSVSDDDRISSAIVQFYEALTSSSDPK